MNASANQIVIERDVLSTVSGHLECRLSYLPEGNPGFGVVIAGPHPYMGGEIDNNVLRYLSEALAAENGLILTFNYSGVGESSGPAVDVPAAMQMFWNTGKAPQDPAWVDDVRSALGFARSLTTAPLFACGYSFGSWAVSMNLGAVDLCGAILISPTVGRHDFSRLSGCDLPLCVVSSDSDFLTTEAQMNEWVAALPCIRQYEVIHQSEHFFRGEEMRLAALCARFVKEFG